MRASARLTTLTDVVDLIYEAALQPALLREAIDQVAAYCQASFGSMTSRDAMTGTHRATTRGVDENFIASYAAKFAKTDPASRFALRVPVDTPGMTEDWQPRKEFLASPMYREVMHPANIEDRAAVVAIRDARHLVTLGLGRGRGEALFNRKSLARLAEVSPHVRRAMQVAHRLKAAEEGAGSLAEVLERMKDGVFVVNDAYRVIYTNSAAQRMLERARVLTVRNGQLSALLPREGAALHGALFNALQAGHDPAAPPGGNLILRSRAGDPELLLAVSPLRDGAGGGGHGRRSIRALVVARQPDAPVVLSPEVLREWFGLTPAEAKLALALSDGERLGDVAGRRGLSKTTVRTQLAAIFDKTGARRQADLVKLLAAVSGGLMSTAPIGAAADGGTAEWSAASGNKKGLAPIAQALDLQ